MRQLLITCEHGGNEVPKEYKFLFCDAQELLKTHRGYDPGALDLAREIADRFQAELQFSTLTRLLVDLNRSLTSRSLFSSLSKALPAAAKEQLLNQVYYPYRTAVEKSIAQKSLAQPVLHLSIHSFTPIWKGEKRKGDIGLLYDSQKQDESLFCKKWQQRISQENKGFIVRRNYPYLGRADGFTTSLRVRYPKNYLGIEVEVNQQYPLNGGKRWETLKQLVVHSLEEICHDEGE